MWTAVVILWLFNGEMIERSKSPFPTEAACTAGALRYMQYNLTTGRAMLAGFKCTKKSSEVPA